MNATTFSQDFYNLSHYMKAVAYKLTNDFHLAEDLYQDTAFRAFRHQDKYQPNTNFKAWLITIMRNIYINDFRKKKRKGSFLDSTSENYWLNSGGRSIVNEGEGIVLYEELEGLIDNLEEGLRKPFLMAYQGFKYDEISDEMDLPLGTVKSRIFIARKILKKQIAALYNANSSLELVA